jgi:hypothetical protein
MLSLWQMCMCVCVCACVHVRVCVCVCVCVCWDGGPVSLSPMGTPRRESSQAPVNFLTSLWEEAAGDCLKVSVSVLGEAQLQSWWELPTHPGSSGATTRVPFSTDGMEA